MKEIHIVTAIDDNYAQHVTVMLCSLFENNTHQKFVIHLFHREVKQEHLQKIHTTTATYGQQLVISNISIDNAERFLTSGHITLAAYFRIFIPAYLDKSIDKVLYLDADIVIAKDISNLWNKNIERYFLAAAENVTPGARGIWKTNEQHKYFNDGVMLINLKLWREHHIMEKTLSFIEQNPDKIVFHDQDALNAVLCDKWLLLHPKYNMQGALFMDEFTSFRGNPEEIEEAILSPVIIHYSTPLKPWHYLTYHPYTQEYYRYLALTPWKGYKPVDKNFLRVVRKFTRPLLKKAGIHKILGKHLY